MAKDDNKVMMVAITDILADDNWNARSGNWKEDEDSETGRSFKNLVESIRKKGIEDAIELRPNPGKTKFPYVIVAGFRRYHAAKIVGLTTIPATVRELSESEARARNIRENVEREDLKGADLAWAVAELAKTSPTLTDEMLGAEVGISQSYANKLRRIMQELPVKLTKAWREASVEIRVREMYSLVLLNNKEAAEAKFREIVEGRAEKEEGDKNGKGGRDKTAFVKLKGKAFDKGREVGIMAQLGAVTISPKAEWTLVVSHLFTIPNTIKAKEIAKIASSMGEGYQSGLTEELTDDEDEVEEATP